jgi:GNAT superfamily N-acetyltransferase
MSEVPGLPQHGIGMSERGVKLEHPHALCLLYSDVTSPILRLACTGDLRFFSALSAPDFVEAFRAPIRDGRVRIVQHAGSPVGFLKFSFLWDSHPFIEALMILESERGKGHGSRAVRAWEHEMKAQGFDVVLTSTRADERHQHFWRQLGYVDCGMLLLPDKPAELFLQRMLT